MKHLTLRNACIAAICCCFSIAAFAQSQPRFSQLKLEDTSGEQRVLAERMLRETRIGLAGPWNIALRSPVMGQAEMDLYNYYRYHSSLPTRLVELAILITSKEWSAPYEWYIHYPLALKEGISQAALAEIQAGRRPSDLKADELALRDLATEILQKHVVTDAAFARAKAALGEKGVVDAASLIGTYVSFAALLNVAQVWGPEKDGPEYLPRPR